MKRALPAVIALLTLAVTAYFWVGHVGDANRAVWIVSALGIACASIGVLVPADRARIHTAVAAGLMLTVAAFATSRVIGRWPFEWDAMPDARYAGFIASSCLVVGIGLLRGRFWARWAAIAFATGNIIGGGLNSFNLRGARTESAWLAAVGVIAGLLLLVQLMRSSVRDRFTANAQHAVWTSRDRLVRSARWAAIANFAAAPMLLLYALGQPVAPQTIVSALVIAPVLGIGGALVVARRTLGVIVLGAGGIALLGHIAATASYVPAASLGTAGYYTAFWLPAAVLGITAGALALWRSR